MKITSDTFSSWIDNEIKNNNISAKALADNMGISYLTIRGWRKGNTGITLYYLEMLTKFLGYEIHIVKGGVDSNDIIDEINARGIKELLMLKCRNEN